MSTPPERVSRLLASAAGDDKLAADELMSLVYDELRRLAAHHLGRLTPGQTLQPTALVHEAYLKLVKGDTVEWASKRCFFKAAARSMRNILVDRARKKGRIKHGGAVQRVSVEPDRLTDEPRPEELLALEDALLRLEKQDERKGDVVMLRYYAGLTIDESAKMLGVSAATVERDWNYAKAWLRREMDR